MKVRNSPYKKCPICSHRLNFVRQSSHSFLNKEQFNSVKAGDYFCINCKPTQGLKYKYFWKNEI